MTVLYLQVVEIKYGKDFGSYNWETKHDSSFDKMEVYFSLVRKSKLV